jgi:hypothetical protein
LESSDLRGSVPETNGSKMPSSACRRDGYRILAIGIGAALTYFAHESTRHAVGLLIFTKAAGEFG